MQKLALLSISLTFQEDLGRSWDEGGSTRDDISNFLVLRIGRVFKSHYHHKRVTFQGEVIELEGLQGGQ
jgi:hypothetical protein